MWEDNTKMHIQEIGWVGVYRIIWLEVGIRWRAFVNAVMILRFPYNLKIFSTSRGIIDF
jgi:hypothetical protein